MSIRLIVDDQELVRIGFGLFLQTQDGLEVVGEAPDGQQALARARELRPDVILMDIRMPIMDGIEATARLRDLTLDPPPRVLVLTTFDLDEYVYGALRAGAAGFLLKDAPRERLVEAIHVIHAGEALLSPSITRRLIEDYARRTDPIQPPDAAARTHPTRTRGPDPRRPRPIQQRDRATPDRHGGHRKKPRRQRAHEARTTRPRPSRRPRIRKRHRHGGHLSRPFAASRAARVPRLTATVIRPSFYTSHWASGREYRGVVAVAQRQAREALGSGHVGYLRSTSSRRCAPNRSSVRWASYLRR